MSFPIALLERQDLSDWCILHCYRGSIAHGMYIPNTDPLSIDDKDTMAICVPPKEYYLGLKGYGSRGRGTQELKFTKQNTLWDIVIYEAKKAIHLLAKGNPNILMMLWVSPHHYIKIAPAGQLLIDNRDLFVGRHVYKSFVGYAHGQLHRMTHHAKEGYMGKKRMEIIKKFGYDLKNATHCIRLLRMGIEFLKDGELYVERHDSPQLLEIKRGEWSLEKVKVESDRLFKIAEEMYLQSQLPKAPNRDAISKLCVEVVETAWQK